MMVTHLPLRGKAWVMWRHCCSIVPFFLEIGFWRMVFPGACGWKDNSWEFVTLCLLVWSQVLGEVGFWGHFSLERLLGALGPWQQMSWRGCEQSIWLGPLFLQRAERE